MLVHDRDLAPELADVRRFSHVWEKAASIDLRVGCRSCSGHRGLGSNAFSHFMAPPPCSPARGPPADAIERLCRTEESIRNHRNRHPSATSLWIC